ncbi:hypothetical protein E2C01_077153 [Portunus trituberculatus]|uniref:Uncharacterized protein n=1 Tax=Portunus trituberculatus TaxID=210409 RepID=A0A5B7IQK8_PORTR|nr:hypothetical protein [Portunus trituberculatus]
MISVLVHQLQGTNETRRLLPMFIKITTPALIPCASHAWRLAVCSCPDVESGVNNVDKRRSEDGNRVVL